MPLPHRRRRGIKIAATIGVIAVVLFGALQPGAPGLLPRHRRGRARRHLPGPALRPAVRDRALLRAALDRRTGRLALARAPGGRDRAQAALRGRRDRHRRGHRAARGSVPPVTPTPNEARRSSSRSSRRTRRPRSSRGRPSRLSLERPQPRALRADPRRPAGHGRLHGRADRRVRADRRPQLHLRALLPGPLPRDPLRDPLPAARRRPLPVSAGGAAGRVRGGDAVPPRRRPRARPGELVRGRAGRLLADDHLPARLRDRSSATGT